MSDKSIPSEVVSQIAQLPKDVSMGLLEQGTGGLVKKQTTTDDQAKKQIEELKMKEDKFKKDNAPSLKLILEQQEGEKEILREEEQERQQEEVQEMQEKQQEHLEQQNQLGQEASLSGTGHKQTAHDQFVKKSSEQITKQGM